MQSFCHKKTQKEMTKRQVNDPFAEKLARAEDYAVKKISTGQCDTEMIRFGSLGSAPNPAPVQKMEDAGFSLSERMQCEGIDFVSVEAGGGGDCFFHSVAYSLSQDASGEQLKQQDIRNIAADAITAENCEDFLMDTAGIYVDSPEGEMTPSAPRPPPLAGTFDPIAFWNATRSDRQKRIDGLKAVIRTPGNFYWGDSTTAALLENALGLNILMLANRKSKDGRSRLGVSRDYIGRVKCIAKSLPVAFDPVADSGNRPTIMIYNIQNRHWCPTCVVCRLQKGQKTLGYRRKWRVPPERYGIFEHLF